ncbi:hypothetical protein [[Eubacterium] cellulosolvens]
MQCPHLKCIWIGKAIRLVDSWQSKIKVDYMGRKFGGRWKSGGRREEGKQKTLTCLKCDKPFPLSEFADHVKECKGNSKKN